MQGIPAAVFMRECEAVRRFTTTSAAASALTRLAGLFRPLHADLRVCEAFCKAVAELCRVYDDVRTRVATGAVSVAVVEILNLPVVAASRSSLVEALNAMRSLCADYGPRHTEPIDTAAMRVFQGSMETIQASVALHSTSKEVQVCKSGDHLRAYTVVIRRTRCGCMYLIYSGPYRRLGVCLHV